MEICKPSKAKYLIEILIEAGDYVLKAWVASRAAFI